jgi:FkbM family methyltransferase
MISRLLIQFYCVMHGKWHLPGAGWLVRSLAKWFPGLQSFPLQLPGVGMALLDFRDGAAFGMLNLSLGEFANDQYLFRNLTHILKPGDVFWDIGANVGFVAQYFAHPKHQLSSLHAFEPNPIPFRTLQSLFRNHPFAVAHPFGLGNKDEAIPMNVSAKGSLIGSIARDLKEGKQIQVQIRNGDAVWRELGLPFPNVIKMDVEGFEPNVFSGLSETIAQCRPIIIFEHIWLSDEQVKQCIPLNYALYFINDDGVIHMDFSTRLKGHDAMLIPNEKMELAKGILP